jgi:hypothetical protein
VPEYKKLSVLLSLLSKYEMRCHNRYLYKEMPILLARGADYDKIKRPDGWTC